MFFRFGSAIVLVVLISLAGTALEKRNLQLKRAVSRQHYRLEVLLEQHSARRVEAQRLGAPIRLIETIDAAAAPENPAKPASPGNPQKRQKRRDLPPR